MSGLRFFKMNGRLPVECRSQGELKAWLHNADLTDTRVVARTEIEGLLISTVFKYIFDPARDMDVNGNMCHFETVLFYGSEDDFDATHTLDFPSLAEGRPSVNRFICPTWEMAESVHNTVVKLMRQKAIEAGELGDAIIEGLLIKAKMSDQ